MRRVDKGFARRHAERTAHEFKVLNDHNGRRAAYRARGNRHGVIAADFGAGAAQAVRIFLVVAEFQRIGQYFWEFDVLPLPAVEQGLKARLRPDSHVIAAGGDPKRLFHIRLEDHFAGLRTFQPKIVAGGFAFFKYALNARRRQTLQPAHALGLLNTRYGSKLSRIVDYLNF